MNASASDLIAFDTVRAIAVILDERDPYTFQHSHRVARLAHEIAVGCGLSDKELSLTSVSATFHDIGKIGIPDHILQKPTQLTDDEWAVVRSHPERGERIFLASTHPDAALVANVIRHHHEHFNGNGYPDKLAGEGIPVVSRILSLADSYDAMTIARSYHQGRTHHKALEIMESELGTKLDPLIFQTFKKIIEHSASRAKN